MMKSCCIGVDLHFSPGLDNFYEKIGAKLLDLLYPADCRLQVPKQTSSGVRYRSAEWIHLEL